MLRFFQQPYRHSINSTQCSTVCSITFGMFISAAVVAAAAWSSVCGLSFAQTLHIVRFWCCCCCFAHQIPKEYDQIHILFANAQSPGVYVTHSHCRPTHMFPLTKILYTLAHTYHIHQREKKRQKKKRYWTLIQLHIIGWIKFEPCRRHHFFFCKNENRKRASFIKFPIWFKKNVTHTTLHKTLSWTNESPIWFCYCFCFSILHEIFCLPHISASRSNGMPNFHFNDVNPKNCFVL